MSSYPMTRLGGQAFNHSQSQDAEAEYDRLRDAARAEAAKRSSCFDKSQQAYKRGDGSAAHQLSEEGKQHAAKMDAFNKQASDFIFRENNAPGRVADDTIDLHGQFVEEAEDILEQRIRYAQQNGQNHLHVIVGKGNHSVNHVQKIKPRVEQICQQLGLQYATEPNAGRMYINLQGGAATMPPANAYQPGGQHGGFHQQPHGGHQQSGHQQGGYPGGQQQGYQGNNQQQGGNDEIEKMALKLLPKIIKKLERACCNIM